MSWDSYDAYLFDIDGTLLECKDAVHYFAFCEALKFMSGKPLNLDGVVAHGNTDQGILRDALTLANIDRATWSPLLADALLLMKSFVSNHIQEMRVVPIAGAAKATQYLLKKGAVLGVATGNVEAIGRTKLELAGFGSTFAVEGYSDGFEDRPEVFRRAADLLCTKHRSIDSICIVGDTPSDIRAAHACKLPVIGVSTGIFTTQQLMAESPQFCVSSLLELNPTPELT